MKKFFEETEKNLNEKEIREKIAEATTFSSKTVQRIFVNGNESPKKTKNREAVFTWDTFDRNVINSVISEFHNKGIFPTMRDIFLKIKGNKNISFENCEKSTFYLIIKRMGFKYANVQELKRKTLMERSDIVLKRREFLREKKRLETDYPKSLWIYLDETFIHKNLTSDQMIVCQNNLPNGLKIPIGKGARYSIIHAGSKDGLVPNAELILVNKELNGENFEKWISEQLLLNIPKQSIIVLDNAPLTQKESIPSQLNKIIKNS